jgi:hypothetical protein
LRGSEATEAALDVDFIVQRSLDAEFKDDSVAGINVASKRSERSCVYDVDFTMDVKISSSAFQRWSRIENWSTATSRIRHSAAKMAILVAFWLCF